MIVESEVWQIILEEAEEDDSLNHTVDYMVTWYCMQLKPLNHTDMQPNWLKILILIYWHAPTVRLKAQLTDGLTKWFVSLSDFSADSEGSVSQCTISIFAHTFLWKEVTVSQSVNMDQNQTPITNVQMQWQQNCSSWKTSVWIVLHTYLYIIKLSLSLIFSHAVVLSIMQKSIPWSWPV